MSLIKCPECLREISDKAETCPQCGFPILRYLEGKKAEELKANKIEEDRVGSERQQEQLIQVSEYIKAQVTDKSNYSEFDSTINKPLIFCAIGALFLFFIYMAYSSKVDTDKRNQQEIALKRNGFNSAKTLLNSGKTSNDELDKVKASLESVEMSMPEYKEAQELLVAVVKRIAIVEERRKELENKQLQDALLTAGGKRIYSKHPNWTFDDCNTIAKGQIHVGMTADQVRTTWGRPYKINRTSTASTETEQWVMHEYGNSYVYFDNGICTAIQN